MDEDSLAHSKWRCQYHIVFAPKYRRQVIYGKIKEDIGKILRKLCDYKDVEIIRAEACPDHIHMLVSIPPKISVASFMGYLKGKSSIMIFEKYANMRYKYGNRKFWCRGYYVDTVGKNEEAIKKYIENQLREDKEYEQLNMKEFIELIRNKLDVANTDLLEKDFETYNLRDYAEGYADALSDVLDAAIEYEEKNNNKDLNK